MARDNDALPALPHADASLSDYQRFVHDLERFHGWLDVDLVHNCFLMGEEVGELFKAVRKKNKLFDEVGTTSKSIYEVGTTSKSIDDHDERQAAATTDVAHEIVDVMNYLLAIANRLDIDVAKAFREKNGQNLRRTWSA